MGILLKLRGALTSTLERDPRECWYGNTHGAFANCDAIIPQGQGVTYGNRIFCSEEHALDDQAEATM